MLANDLEGRAGHAEDGDGRTHAKNMAIEGKMAVEDVSELRICHMCSDFIFVDNKALHF